MMKENKPKGEFYWKAPGKNFTEDGYYQDGGYFREEFKISKDFFCKEGDYYKYSPPWYSFRRWKLEWRRLKQRLKSKEE